MEITNINESQLIKKNDSIIKIRPLNLDPSKSQMVNESEGSISDGPISKVTQIGDNQGSIDKSQFAWVRRQNNFFISAKPNVDSIPSGLYDIKSSYEQGVYIEKRSVILDQIFELPDEITEKVITDVEKFWNSKEKYLQYRLTYKRGILLYGPPGTGKSSLLNILISKIISDYDGIVLNMEYLDTFIPMVRNLRALEPNRPILALVEDLDGFLNSNSVKQFLNLLDGNMAADNIVYLATTNYIDRIEDRVMRSSRFDRKYLVDLPSTLAREYYIKNKLDESDLEKFDIDQIVNDTENMSFADIKELIVSICVFDIPYDDVINELRIMNNINQ